MGFGGSLEAVTVRYVDVRLERKQFVLDKYHKTVQKKKEFEFQDNSSFPSNIVFKTGIWGRSNRPNTTRKPASTPIANIPPPPHLVKINILVVPKGRLSIMEAADGDCRRSAIVLLPGAAHPWLPHSILLPLLAPVKSTRLFFLEVHDQSIRHCLSRHRLLRSTANEYSVAILP